MDTAPEPSPIVTAACRAIDAAGGPVAVARHFDIRLTAIHQWRKRGIPPARVIDVEALTGVSRHELRPDVFGVAS